MQTENKIMEGKVCLVTGATAGIGKATAFLLDSARGNRRWYRTKSQQD